MDVMAVDSPWMRWLIFGQLNPGQGATAHPFNDNVAYGSVAGDSNEYLDFPLNLKLDPYNLLDDALDTSKDVPGPRPSWFPYLALERTLANSRNYSDGIVPVWSSAIPGSYLLAPTAHGDYVRDLDTIRYVVQSLSSANLPKGSILNRYWNNPIIASIVSASGHQWEFTPGAIAPRVQNDIYQQVDGVGRINPLALREINTATVTSVGANSAVVSWVTATDTDSQVSLYQYRTLINVGPQLVRVKAVSAPTRTKVHRVLLTGLNSNTQYYYDVESRVGDGDGGFLTLSSNAAANGDRPSFRTTSPAKPDLYVSVTNANFAARTFAVRVSNLGGPANRFRILNISFSVNSYHTSMITPDTGLDVGSVPQLIHVQFEGTAAVSSLLCRINYEYFDEAGNRITANSSWQRVK